MWDADSSLAPSLLIAMPQLQDPNFAKSVVLLCEHREEGAMGLVINRCTDTPASTIVQLDPPPEGDSGLAVWVGGPVDPARGWLLLGQDLGDGIEVSPGLYLSASRDLLRRVLQTRELAASAWLTVPVDKELLFDTPSEAMWEVAIRRLGIEPHALALGPGVH